MQGETVKQTSAVWNLPRYLYTIPNSFQSARCSEVCEVPWLVMSRRRGARVAESAYLPRNPSIASLISRLGETNCKGMSGRPFAHDIFWKLASQKRFVVVGGQSGADHKRRLLTG
jgi:hypothetical protein